MSNLDITLACWNYDRTRPLADGSVRPDGIDLRYLNYLVEETFFRQARFQEFEASEMSFSSYVVSLFRDPQPFIAIPVFPSRYFRHSCIYINANAGINEPKDLIGKKIGVPEYQMTAPVWIRGILSEHYGVPVDSVTYFTGGEEEPGRPEKIKLDLPDNIKVEAIPEDKTLAQMLRDGEIDAFHTARKPSTYDRKTVKRMFENYVDVEKDYYNKTKIFPPMHTIVIRRDIYDKHRWVAQNLYKAFVEAQQRVYEDFNQTAALMSMLPWGNAAVEEAIELMGPDWWPYGFEANRESVEVFLKYHFESGLSKRLLKPEDVFAPETLEAFKI